MSTNLGMIAIAALVGAGGAVLVLRAQAPIAVPEAGAPPPSVTSGVAAVSTSTRPNDDPWSAAAPAVAAPTRTATMPRALQDSPLPTADAPRVRAQDLPDREIARLARADYAQDCPAIVERRAPRNGRFDVICSNGVVLRVHAMDGELTRIGPVR